MMGNPALIIIDQPTEGLAPKIVDWVKSYLLLLKQKGLAVRPLNKSSRLPWAYRTVWRSWVMGKLFFEGTPQDLNDQEGVKKKWLEV